MLEDVLMSWKSDRVILKFEKSTSRKDALSLIGELLSDFYSQQSMLPLYRGFKNLGIEPNTPARKKDKDPEQVTYILIASSPDYILLKGKRAAKETRRTVLRFFNILPVRDTAYASYQIMFSARNLRYINEFISDNQLAQKEMHDFSDYAYSKVHQVTA